MNKLIFTIASIAFTSYCTNSVANTISSYQQLSSVIQQGGAHFTIVSDISKCTGQAGAPIGYFSPNAFMIVPSTPSTPGNIATSDLHFTNVTGSPLYEYVLYTFKPDNTVAITATNYNPQTFVVIGNPESFTCTLNNGVQVSY